MNCFRINTFVCVFLCFYQGQYICLLLPPTPSPSACPHQHQASPNLCSCIFSTNHSRCIVHKADFLWTTPPWLPASWWTVQTLQGPCEGYAEPMWHHTISSGNDGKWQSRLAIHVQVSSARVRVSMNWKPNVMYENLVCQPPATFSARSVTGCTILTLDLLHVKSHARWWDPSHRRLSPWWHEQSQWIVFSNRRVSVVTFTVILHI